MPYPTEERPAGVKGSTPREGSLGLPALMEGGCWEQEELDPVMRKRLSQSRRLPRFMPVSTVSRELVVWQEPSLPPQWEHNPTLLWAALDQSSLDA